MGKQMVMRNLASWLEEYGESHQNALNKKIHWICVPTIFFSITGLLFAIKIPGNPGGIPLNLAIPVLALVALYYFRLSFPIGVGMLLFALSCLLVAWVLETYLPLPLWASCLMLFVLAWIGQFYGHSVEGKKPSFLKDIQFLLIGPAWLMHFLLKKLNIRY
jgi:uncharacterized membrane protein YGL010W